MRRLAPLVLLAACAGADDDGAPADTDTDPPARSAEELIALFEAPGAHGVGYAEDTVVYDDPAGDGARALRLGVWYPTAATSGREVTFLGPHAAEGVLDDPPPVPGRFPLVVFSHGHQGNHDNASHLMAWFASHGFVAVAPEHTGNTLTDTAGRTAAIYLQRPHDVSATLDHVLDPDVPWSAALDGRVLAVGHSFGGYTLFPLAGGAWAVDWWDDACAEGSDDPFCAGWTPALADALREGAADPRIRAFVTLSGGNWGQLREEGLAGVTAPLLLVSGGLDGSVSNEGASDPIWRDLAPGGKVRVDLAHGDHQTYTDYAGLTALPGTSPDALAPERGHRLLYVYLGAFAARHLFDEPGAEAILDGGALVDEDVTLSTK